MFSHGDTDPLDGSVLRQLVIKPNLQPEVRGLCPLGKYKIKTAVKPPADV